MEDYFLSIILNLQLIKLSSKTEQDLLSIQKFSLDKFESVNSLDNIRKSEQYIEEKEYVIRKPPKGAVYGHDMGREYKVLNGLNNGFNKAPIVYAYSDDNNIIGTPFYIMELS